MSYDNLKRLALRRELVLGSGSPRRVRLLTETKVRFRQVIPEGREERQAGEAPIPFAQRLAQDKALWVAGRTGAAAPVVIGCDTIVVLEGTVLGKPVDKAEAFNTLSALTGKEHVVCTALALAIRDRIVASGHDLTRVLFNEATPEQIREYIATGEPMDKAGAYGIQGMGAFLVDTIDGNLDNVIGLPRMLLDELAGEAVASL